MFNGIIFDKGTVTKVIKRKNGVNLFLRSNIKLSKKDLGVSISCDGVCLTLISYKRKIIEFYLSNETLKKSKFRNVKINDKINLELPLKFGQNVSGHICQGHVDTISEVKNIKKVDKSLVFEFKIAKEFKKLLVQKASILINGVSLTISKIKKESFEIWVIPHTLKLTNLSNIIKNDLVNIEIDILSKYTKKFINEKK
jgi:riboflavin synthase|tara:strand:+ start:1157 stop:1750 length:594 start_codon:yes stop_codon:yes gene_type:complete